MRIIYGIDSGVIENFNQCVAVDIPDTAKSAAEYMSTRIITGSLIVTVPDVLNGMRDVTALEFNPEDADRIMAMVRDVLVSLTRGSS